MAAHCKTRGNSRSTDFQFRPAIKHGVSADADPGSAIFAEKFAPALGKLTGEELLPAQPGTPVRDQRAVRGTGDRILRDARSGREKARDEIAVGAGRSADDAEAVEPRELRRVRLEAEDFLGRGKHREVVAILEKFAGKPAEGAGDQSRHLLATRRRPRGKIERDEFTVVLRTQLADFRLKADRLAGKAEFPKDDECRGRRGPLRPSA